MSRTTIQSVDHPAEQAVSDSWSSRFPSAYTILFGLIAFVAALTWLIPAGKYQRVTNEALGKEVPVPGTFEAVESNPQNWLDVFFAPIKGFYDPSAYTANAIDVALFVLVIGGFLGVVNSTGAISGGIRRAMESLKGRESWMIPILMGLFALGGTTYGMAEETLAFYALIVPIMIAAGYDALTGAAIILLGAGIGVLGSTINPFATTIASNAANIPFTQGMGLRIFMLLAGWIICVVYVMRYAAKVKTSPDKSIVSDLAEKNRNRFSQALDTDESEFSFRDKILVFMFALTFLVMIWGVATQGWWMGEMTALFLGASLAIGVVGWLGEKGFTNAFIDGAKDLLGVALIIGIARGIVVVMDEGNITDSILHTCEQAIQGYSSVAYINALYWIEVFVSFFVPSTSGLAVLSMPILAPLSDFANVDRSLAVTAYQSASGIVNLITPTSAVVIGGLSIAGVPYNRWLRFIWPLLLILTVLIMVILTIGVLL